MMGKSAKRPHVGGERADPSVVDERGSNRVGRFARELRCRVQLIEREQWRGRCHRECHGGSSDVGGQRELMVLLEPVAIAGIASLTNGRAGEHDEATGRAEHQSLHELDEESARELCLIDHQHHGSRSGESL